MIVIERIASAQPLRFDHPTGTEIQLHASAMGKVLLTFSPGSPKEVVHVAATDDPVHPSLHHVSRIPRQGTSTSIRDEGFATNYEERHEGVSGVAAPSSRQTVPPTPPSVSRVRACD